MSSDLLKNFDCNVLCNRDGTAAEGITLLGAAFGFPSPIRSQFSKFVSKTESILLYRKGIDDRRLRFSCSATAHQPASCHTSFAALRRGFTNISVHSGLNYPRRLCRHTRHPSGAVVAPEVSWTQATLPIRHGGLGLIPASQIADAAYVGSVTDTSELSGVLTEAIPGQDTLTSQRKTYKMR